MMRIVLKIIGTRWYVLCLATGRWQVRISLKPLRSDLGQVAHQQLSVRKVTRTISLISSPGGVRANEPAFGQRTIIIIIFMIVIVIVVAAAAAATTTTIIIIITIIIITIIIIIIIIIIIAVQIT